MSYVVNAATVTFTRGQDHAGSSAPWINSYVAAAMGGSTSKDAMSRTNPTSQAHPELTKDEARVLAGAF